VYVTTAVALADVALKDPEDPPPPVLVKLVAVETGTAKFPAPTYGAKVVALNPIDPLPELENPETVSVWPAFRLRFPVVKEFVKSGFTKLKPANAPKLY